MNIKSVFSKIKRKNDEITPVIPEKEPMMFDAVNIDTNNTCNQRCRFCFTSFDEKKINMDIETFKGILKILPYVKDYAGGGYGFYLSCIYEPTINPNLLKYLSLLPPIAKNKCFITTNLAIPMNKEFIKKILLSNIHLINISIESLKENKFEYITQNKKFKTYKNNLETLENVIKETPDIPKFRFITILLKENREEIIDLIKYTNEHFPIESHEVRTPYINYYKNMEWNKNQYMPKSETEQIITELKSLDYHLDINIDSIEDLEILYETNNENNDEKIKDFYTRASERISVVEDYEYLFLRINPDGTCIDKKTNLPEKIPINESEKYFKQKLFELYEYKAKVTYCSTYKNNKEIIAESFIMMDKIVQNEAIIELSGWCCPDRDIDINKLIIRLTGFDGDVHHYHTSTRKRLDADAFKGKKDGWCGGYTTYIEKSKLKDNEYFLDFLYEDYSGNTISYRWNHSIKIN